MLLFYFILCIVQLAVDLKYIPVLHAVIRHLHVHIKNCDTFTVHLMFYELKIMENNTVFQTMHHNFHVHQFVEIELHLSESLINCSSGDMQDFLQ